MSNERLKRNQRHIIERIIIRGTLILDTPTCLGSGDADGLTDMMLVRDSISSHALLTGASIAGALRNYVCEHENGYGKEEQNNSLSTSLFGAISKDDDGDQSSLIIYDSISNEVPQIELRDGVKINSITRTVDPESRAKYDLELLQAGTEFPLCFELSIEGANKADLLKGLAIALQGLEPKNGSKSGEICLGMKKRRGFGRCHVKEWQVWNFDLTDPDHRTAWLTLDHSWLTDPACSKPPAVDASIVEAIKKTGLPVVEDWEDKRDRFLIHATFNLVGSLLIRSGQDTPGRASDVVHLKSYRVVSQQIKWLFDFAIKIIDLLPQEIDSWNSENLELFFFGCHILKSKVLMSILSATSLAGVLRHRAERIVNTLHEINPQITQEIVNDIFGFAKDKKEAKQPESKEVKKKPDAKASRLVVRETVIENAEDLVQNRIAIDRFTGGAYHGALFDEQPIFGGDDTIVTIELELRNPHKHEIGLLLLLLKDLWTRDLPVGCESSIGRGRLQGKEATLTWKKYNKKWIISQATPEQQIQVSGSKQDLEDYVEAFVKHPQEEVKEDA